MQRTVKLRLGISAVDKDKLFKTVERFNLAAQRCAEWGYKHRTRDKRRVHDATYYEVRRNSRS